jgi:hypothetical protein
MILSTISGYVIEGGHNGQIRLAREETNSYDFATQFFPGNTAPVDPTGYCMYDLIDLMDNLRVMPFESEVQDAAQFVKSAANDAILYFAVNPYHGNIKGANGLTIYFPNGIDTIYSEKYDEVDFAMDTQWDEFLHHLHVYQNAHDTPPSVLITTPGDDDSIDRGDSDKISIKGTAFDAQDDISLIEIKIDNESWIEVGASSTWYYDLPLKGLKGGEHTIYARSFDGNDYSAEDSVKIFIVGEAVQEEEAFINPLLIVLLVVIVVAAVLFILKNPRKS